MVRDVVCRMEIDPKTAEATAEYMGERYYFCAEACADVFKKEPEKYVRAA